MQSQLPKTLLICHNDDTLTHQSMSRWLSSFSQLVGIVLLKETRQRKLKRIQREIQRVGLLRFIDIVALRLYHKIFLADKDDAWQKCALGELQRTYTTGNESVPVLVTPSPNTPEAENFVRMHAPDMMLARCKTIVDERVFTIPKVGTFVLHAGICPEYRNAHGCFWALANNDLKKVGMTLLKIDKGVDTGPVYGYYSYPFDEIKESHYVIQQRVILDNLDAIRDKLMEIYRGSAVPLATSGRPSATWGQPWLTRYLRWKWKARRGKT